MLENNYVRMTVGGHSEIVRLVQFSSDLSMALVINHEGEYSRIGITALKEIGEDDESYLIF